MQAGMIAKALSRDRNIVLPTRPRLCAGLHMVELNGGLVIEGAQERQWLTGKAVKALLPRLLGLVDGTRDEAALADAVGAPIKHIQSAIALLWARGLLEEGEGAPAADEQDIFLSRAVHSTGANSSWNGASIRLRRASVAVVGADPIGGALAILLRRSSISTEILAGNWRPSEANNPGLIVVVDATAAPDIDNWARAAGSPWMWASSSRGQIGPIFYGATAPCWSCACSIGVGCDVDHQSIGHQGPAFGRLFAGLVAGEILHLIARIGSTPAFRTFAQLEGDSASLSRRFVPRQATCSVCSSPPTPDILSSAAIVYEQATEAAPPDLLNPRAHRLHYDPRFGALARETKSWPTAQRLLLSDRGDGILTPPPHTLNLDMIGAISRLCAGIQDKETGRRWAPTGGNLGSVLLYWATPGNEELACGVYAYDPWDHAIVKIGNTNVFGSFKNAIHSPADRLAHLVLTADLGRISRKYTGYGYRLVHLDAGCAIGQCRVVCASLGLALEVNSHWDDWRIADILAADLDREPVTAVLSLAPREGRL